jgi:predicted Rossmann fold nucleotide-binding protein DprA/Smf involved in DNA uptake
LIIGSQSRFDEGDRVPLLAPTQEARPTGSIAITPAEVIGALNDVESKYAPSQLFLAGNRDLLRGGRRVSVIGSRKASSQGLRRARVIARSLVGHGIVVVSGLAAGIDRAAHEAAIAWGGQTMAVIGSYATEPWHC